MKIKKSIVAVCTVVTLMVCSLVPSIVSALTINVVSSGVNTEYYGGTLTHQAYFQITTSGLTSTMYYKVYFLDSNYQSMYVKSTQAINGTKYYYSSHKDKDIPYYGINYRPTT